MLYVYSRNIPTSYPRQRWMGNVQKIAVPFIWEATPPKQISCISTNEAGNNTEQLTGDICRGAGDEESPSVLLPTGLRQLFEIYHFSDGTETGKLVYGGSDVCLWVYLPTPHCKQILVKVIRCQSGLIWLHSRGNPEQTHFDSKARLQTPDCPLQQ